jgi:hypothetical protein
MCRRTIQILDLTAHMTDGAIDPNMEITKLVPQIINMEGLKEDILISKATYMTVNIFIRQTSIPAPPRK